MTAASSRQVVATIATKECQSGLDRLVSSLRRSGWAGRIDVFCPHGSSLPRLPEGCRLVRAAAWWDGTPAHRRGRKVSGPVSLSACSNVPALCKPELLHHYEDGTELLYLDGADVLVLDHPGALFEMLWASNKVLAAHPYEAQEPGIREEGLEMLSAITGGTRIPRYNNGVIVARVGMEVRLFSDLWLSLLAHVGYSGTLAGRGAKRTVVGDQIAFNLALPTLHKYGKVLDLPAEWNYRGYSNVNACNVRDGLLLSPGGIRIRIAHCSGSRDFRPDIVTAATGALP